MWRSPSITRASLARRVRSKLCSLTNQSQVLTKTLAPKPCHSHLYSTRAFPANPLLQNPRFFSHASFDHSALEPDEVSRSDASSHATTSQAGGLGLDFDEIEEITDVFGLIDQPIIESESQRNAIDVQKLEEVLYLLQSSVGESLEASLNALNLSLNEDFVFRVLETPLLRARYLIRFFRWAIEKKQFPITTSLVDALIHGVCQNAQRNGAYALWYLIKEIGDKESRLLNAELLNDLIASFSRLRKGKAAFEVFQKFDEFGCVPNADTYYFTIDALCQRSIYSCASFVARKMLDAGILPNSEKMGQIIHMFCKAKKIREAHLIYLSAKKSNRYPPQNTVKLLISALAYVNETVDLALEMLDDFSPESCKSAMNQYSHVVHGLCRTKNVDRAKELVLKMIEAGPPPGNTVFNSVIGGFSKSGDMDEAVATLRLMQRRGLKPDVYTYSVIMSGYAKQGQMDEACMFLEEAKKEHSKLCPATFHTLIRGFCKVRDYDKALKLLSEMGSYGVEPNVDEYSKLIQTLCLKALDWRKAEKLLEEMKEKGLFFPRITRGLINAVKEMEQEALANVEAGVEA